MSLHAVKFQGDTKFNFCVHGYQ